jgi:hypothetical protein
MKKTIKLACGELKSTGFHVNFFEIVSFEWNTLTKFFILTSRAIHKILDSILM